MNQQHSILIVDDDQDLAFNLKDILEGEGCNTAVANDGQTAINFCSEQEFDIGLIDINLPDIQGVELIEKLSDLTPKTEYVIITGHASLDTAIAAVRDKKILGYEQKPIDMDSFLTLIRQISRRKLAEEALRQSEEKYRGIFDESITAVYLFDDKKNFLDSNQAGLDLLGYSREELLNMSIPDIDADPIVVLPVHEQLLSGERIINYEHRLKRKDDKVITVLNNSRPLADAKGHVIGMQSTLIDITERKGAEEALQKAYDELEQRVEERTVELLKTNEHLMESQQNLKIKAEDFVELNAALKVLLGKRQEEQEEFQDGILANIRILVEPYLDKLKKSKLHQTQETLLNILISNLNEVISPFTKRLSSQYLNLAPKEIKIANLVKYGKTNKEIAEIQGVTSRTIAAHRENIRRKLGLTNKKTNLRTYLQTLG